MIDSIKYTILGIMVLIFQWMLGDIFSIYGITPNFIVIYIVYIGLADNQVRAIWLGFLLGFVLDALTGTNMIGITSLALAIVGYLAGVFHGRFVRIPVVLQYLLYTSFVLVYFIFTVLVVLQDSQWEVGNIVFLLLLPKTLYTLGILSGIFVVLRVGAE